MNSKIKTLEAVEAAAGVNFEAVKQALLQLPVSAERQANMYNQFVWEMITEAKNKEGREEPWRPDFLNDDEEKWYPNAWLKKDESTPSGFGFSGTDTFCTSSHTGVGARQSFENEGIAKEAIRDFPNEYLAKTLFARRA